MKNYTAAPIRSATGYARTEREPNSLVAVVMEKGWEQVAGVLGVLTSGAAYLPIDAGLPKDRLWHLLQHGEVELVLTQPQFDKKIEWPETLKRLIIDDDNLSGLSEQPLDVIQSPEDIAYVIYTSGSTGLPKGVVIDHRGAVNTILDLNRRFSLTAEGSCAGAFVSELRSLGVRHFWHFGGRRHDCRSRRRRLARPGALGGPRHAPSRDVVELSAGTDADAGRVLGRPRAAAGARSAAYFHERRLDSCGAARREFGRLTTTLKLSAWAALRKHPYGPSFIR